MAANAFISYDHDDQKQLAGFKLWSKLAARAPFRVHDVAWAKLNAPLNAFDRSIQHPAVRKI
jgi:hypothetical protein